MKNEAVYAMKLSRVYPLLVNKAVRKGRTKAEVDEVISWLTGYSADEILLGLSIRTSTTARSSARPPAPNPKRALIKGVVCGVRVEDIEEPLMREIRYLDKLVDELAKGKPMEKVLRK